MSYRKRPHPIALYPSLGIGLIFLLIFSDRVRFGATAVANLVPPRTDLVNVFVADSQSNSQFQVNEYRLENGLKVLLEEQRALPLISLGLWYRVGSKNDPAGLEGLSRLTQELTYRGSNALPGLQGLKILEEAGGHWASYTLRDQSCFLATVPKSSIGEILRLEAARMSMDAFSTENVRKEKDILYDRVLGLNDNPKQVLDFEVSATVFRSNPYRWPPEGVNDSVQKISPEEVWQHYSRYYVPNNAILVAVGDFETKVLLGQIEKLFGGIPRKKDPPQIEAQEPPQRGERRVKVNRLGSIPYLEIAYPAPHILNDDFFAMLMIDAVLNGSEGLRFPIPGRFSTPSPDSWLHKGLVEKKLSTQVSTELIPTQGTYLYKLTLTPPDQFQFQPAEEAFSELMEKLRTVRLSEEEMQKLRAQVLNGQILDQGDCENRAFKLGYLESIASYKLLEEFQAKINQVSSQDLTRVASKYLTDEKRTVGWCVPAEKKSIIQVERLQGANILPVQGPNCPAVIRKGADFRAQPQFFSRLEREFGPVREPSGGSGRNYFADAQAQSWARPMGRLVGLGLMFNRLDSFLFWEPLTLQASPSLDVLTRIEQAGSSAGTVDSASNSWPFKMERKVAPNGATLIVIENRATPTVTLCAVIRAGGARDLEGREGTASFVARLLCRGKKSRSAAKVLNALEQLQARLALETGYFATVLTLEGPNEKLPELLQLLSEIVQSPAFTQFEMESVRAELLADLREGNTSNPQILHRLLREKIYPSGHPFRRPVQGSLASIERIKLTDLDSFYKKNFRPGLFSLIIAGDIQSLASLDAAERLFGSWRVSGSEENIILPEISTAVDSSSQVYTLPEKALCSVGFGVPGIMPAHPDFLAMSIANQVFGKSRSSRLAQRIRNEDGLTDVVESGFLGRAGEGPLAIQATIPPLKVDPLVSAIRSEVERIQLDGIKDSEIESVKKGFINAFWVRLRSNRGLAQEFAFSEMNQLGTDYVSSYPDLVAGISKEQVSECLRKYLDFELGPKVIVGSYEKK